MKKDEKFAWINDKKIPGIKATDDMNVAELDLLIDMIESPSKIEALQKEVSNTQSEIADLKKKIKEQDTEITQLNGTCEELNKALAEAETTSPKSVNPTFTFDKKKYEVVGTGTCVIDGVAKTLTKEEIAKDKAVHAHLVEIQSGFINELK